MTDRRKHVRIILSIVIFFIVLALCSVYFRLTYTPMPSYDLNPSSDLTRWSFMLEDGTIVIPHRDPATRYVRISAASCLFFLEHRGSCTCSICFSKGPTKKVPLVLSYLDPEFIQDFLLFLPNL